MTRRLRSAEIQDSLTDAHARLARGQMPRPLRHMLSDPDDATPLYTDLCAEFGERSLFGEAAA